MYTDASKESRFAGGGFISADGFYDFWEYGSADRHKHIHTLEGDAVLRAARALAPLRSSKRVPFFIDNSAFQLSFKKGRSKSPELNGLLRELFLILVQHKIVCLFHSGFQLTTILLLMHSRGPTSRGSSSQRTSFHLPAMGYRGAVNKEYTSAINDCQAGTTLFSFFQSHHQNSSQPLGTVRVRAWP